MKNKSLVLLLLVALALFVSADALSTPAIGSEVKPRSASAGVNRADIDGQRALRRRREGYRPARREVQGVDFELQTGADGDEQDADVEPEATNCEDEYFFAKGLNPNLKYYTDSPQALANNKGLKEFLAYSRYYETSNLIKNKSPNAVLYQNKITPDEYFMTTGLNPKLKFVGDIPAMWAKNKGLEEWFMYSKYFEKMQKKQVRV